MLRECGVLCIFTYKCTSRHSGVQFFDIGTSKSAPRMWCFVHFHIQMRFSPQRRAIFRHRNFKKCSENVVFCAFSRANVLLATAVCNFSTSELQKVLRDRQLFNILTWKCASRHSGVQFFDMGTSKSAPRMWCFVHFHIQMRFSPQRRAIFRHRNFKKCFENVVFCAFSHTNALLATAARNFSTSELQKVLRECGVLCIFTYKCTSRHSGAQFFDIGTSKSAPRMWCFVHFHVQMCFSPQRCAIFRRQNFKKCSEPDMFFTF